MRIDADTVRAALTGGAILDHYGVTARGPRTVRLMECPACKRKNRRSSCTVDRNTGRWIHHAGPDDTCRGDALALVAAFAGLEIRKDFRAVLELGARIAGISPDTDPAELARVRAEHRARRAELERLAAADRARGEARVPALWERLDRRHQRGERYLAGRGLDPAALRHVVRYYRDGSLAALVHDLTDSAPINIVRRRIDGEPKYTTLRIEDVLGTDDVAGGLSTVGTIAGRIADVGAAAVIVEGMTDTLAGILAFPGRVVLGANGWAMMPRVAAAVAPRLVARGGTLLVTADDDPKGQGVRGAGDALREARRAGLVVGDTARPVDLGAHHDLADAWRAGWRWNGGAA